MNKRIDQEARWMEKNYLTIFKWSNLVFFTLLIAVLSITTVPKNEYDLALLITHIVFVVAVALLFLMSISAALTESYKLLGCFVVQGGTVMFAAIWSRNSEGIVSWFITLGATFIVAIMFEVVGYILTRMKYKKETNERETFDQTVANAVADQHRQGERHE